MKERPILFSGPMVRALLEGRKTQTRRVFNNPMLRAVNLAVGAGEITGSMTEADQGWVVERCPYGQPGDRLWVREKWDWKALEQGRFSIQDYILHGGSVCYAADGGKPFDKWLPSIHMPRRAVRILLEVVSVRVERVQEISRADTEAEGVGNDWQPDSNQFATFQRLWDSINGRKAGCSWEENPWVWVVEFRRMS